MKIIDQSTIDNRANWHDIVTALIDGHKLPKAQISDQFLTREKDTLLSRSAWVDGLGFGVKSVCVMPENARKNMPSVQGAMLVFEDRHGKLEAIIDSDLVTQFKTAGDSVLGAKLLANNAPENYLIIGAGVVAETLIRAYSEIFPSIKNIYVWNRTAKRAQELAAQMSSKGYRVCAIETLDEACAQADIISTATMSKEPVIFGQWIKPGTHIDLIGAFKADMREADDALMQKARIFVDSYDTTLDHIGELKIPLSSGAIIQSDIIADLYQMVGDTSLRKTSSEITVFKNGGGAHLDLMTAKYLIGISD